MMRIAITAIALAAMLAAVPQASLATSADSPQAAVAKKKGKKKKKRRKRPSPAVTAPATAAPSPGVPDLNPCAGDDAAEPDDTLDTATVLTYPGSYDPIHRFRCPNDSDFFKVVVPADGYFIFQMDPAEGTNLALRVYEGGAPTSTIDLGGPGVWEQIGLNNIGEPTPVTFHLEVTGIADPAQSGAYDAIGYET